MNIILLTMPCRDQGFFNRIKYTGLGQAPLFPVGLAYIAKVLEDDGNKIEVIDVYAEQIYYKDLFEKLKNKKFDVIGISALVTHYKYLKWITKKIKKINPECRIVVGNGIASACDKTILENINEVDVCVRGEGEETMRELIHKNFHDLENIKGITFRQNNKITKNQNRDLIQNIDALGMPPFHLFKMELYLKAKFYETGMINLREQMEDKNIKTFSMITARGCPYNCNFCGKIIPSCRLRSIEKIVEEIKHLQKNYNVQGIHFMDELFFVNKERTKQICQELKKLNILWDCQGRVNLVNEELMHIMKNSGCLAIGFGVESGDAQILKNMNKQTTPEQIKEAILGARRAGLAVKNQLIFGYPGENKKTIENTVKLMKEIGDPGRRFSYIVPIPGTKLYQEGVEKGLFPDEEYHLYMMPHAMNGKIRLANYTNFSDYEIPRVMRYYENRMYINHLKNILTDFKQLKQILKTPKFLVKLIIITIRHYIKVLNGEYFFLYNKKSFIFKLFRIYS